MRGRLDPGVVAIAVGLSAMFLAAFGGGVGAVGGVGDTGPLADAGLDQTATEGNTVYLDAGGSTAPNSSIQEYEWTIETPGGETAEPDCPECVSTSFVVEEPGTYAVSVTVTDEEGRTDTDTLYVDVEEYNQPEVTVDGPETVLVDEERTFTAEATATEEPLSSVLWQQGGEYHRSGSLPGEYSVSTQTNVTFTEPGTHEVNATVADELGYQERAALTVEVIVPEPYFAVTITDIDSAVTEGESLTLSATVENVGDAAAAQTVLFNRDGSVLESHDDISLEPGEQQDLEFTWETDAGDAGTYDFGIQTANETDSREASVDAQIQGSDESDVCEGMSLSECLMLYGDLDAEILEFTNGTNALDAEIVAPEDWDVDIEAVPLDSEDHDITIITDEGEELEVGDEGEVSIEHLGSEPTVEVEMQETEISEDSPRVGAESGDELDTVVEVPEGEDNFEEAGDADVSFPGGGSSGPTDDGGNSGVGSGTDSGGVSIPDHAGLEDFRDSDDDGSSSGSGNSPSDGTNTNPVYY